METNISAPIGRADTRSNNLTTETATLQIPLIQRSEWYLPLGVALGVLVLTSLAYIFAVQSAPPDKQFMGIMVNVPDHIQYFSWLRDFATSNLVANKLTPEANAPIFFNLLWWGMAKIGSALGVGYATMFQGLRWVSALLCLPLIYLMTSWFLEKVFWRRTAFLVAVLGGGLGWLLVVGKYTVFKGALLWPLDLYVAEPNTFFSILASPHFVAALLYLAVFDLFLRGAATEQWRYPILAGVLAQFLGWQHAYDLLIVYGVLGIWTALWWLRARHFPRFLVLSCLLIGLLSVWPALYSVLLTSLDPIWKEVLAQFANAGVYTPPPNRLLILLGIPFILALYGALRQRPWRITELPMRTVLLQGWFWIFFLLVYLPTDYQIHMLNGWQVPIAILTTSALFEGVRPLVERWLANRRSGTSAALPKSEGESHNRISVWLAAILLILVIPTNLYLFAWRFVDLGRGEAPYYLYKDELAALDWLSDHVAPDDVVMASLNLGQYVPALSGTHVFLAHWAQTVDYYNKVAMVDTYFGEGATEQERLAILHRFGVDWVAYGPSERLLGGKESEIVQSLEPVFTSGDVTIYRVPQDPSSVAPPGSHHALWLGLHNQRWDASW